MAPLKLPPNSYELLQKCYTTSGDGYLAYTIGDMPDDEITTLCIKIVAHSYEVSVGEANTAEESLGDLRPADKAVRNVADVQGAVESHLQSLDAMFKDGRLPPENPSTRSVYTMGFVVVNANEWQEKGVTLVDIDKRRGKFRVRQCTMPWTDIGGWVVNISIGNMDFDEALEEWEKEDDNDPDNNEDARGGDPNTYPWQFGLYVNATDTYTLRVQSTIDPENASFPPDEYSLIHCTKSEPEEPSLPFERILEKFPCDVADEVGTRITGWGHVRPLKFHRNLFMVVDREKMQEEGVQIVRMFWDEGLDRSNEELKEVGRSARTDITRVDLKSAITTIRALANEQDAADEDSDEDTNEKTERLRSQWQFALFSTAREDLAGAPHDALEPDVYDLEPEEYGFVCSGAGDNPFWKAAFDEIMEEFPNAVQQMVIHYRIMPDGKPRPLGFHPNLFVIVDKEDVEKDGVQIVRMYWDEKLDRSEDEIKDVGKVARTEIMRSDAKSALTKIRAMAAEQEAAK